MEALLGAGRGVACFDLIRHVPQRLDEHVDVVRGGWRWISQVGARELNQGGGQTIEGRTCDFCRLASALDH